MVFLNVKGILLISCGVCYVLNEFIKKVLLIMWISFYMLRYIFVIYMLDEGVDLCIV